MVPFSNRIAFQLKADPALFFWFCDLDCDPVTLICDLDLKILKMYLSTKSELKSRLSEVRASQIDI